MPAWVRGLIALGGGVLFTLLLVSNAILATTPDPGVRQLWAGILSGGVALGLTALVIVLVVQVPIPGLGDRARRVVIFLGTPAAGVAGITFLANAGAIPIPFWGMVSLFVFVDAVAVAALSFVGWLGLRP